MKEFKFIGYDIENKKIIFESYQGELFKLKNNGKKIKIYESLNLMDIKGKEIFSNHIVRIKEFKNLYYGFEFEIEELKQLEIEDIKGELINNFITDFKYDEDFDSYVYKEHDTKKYYGNVCNLRTGIQNYFYHEIEIIGEINLNKEILKEVENER